ncbi:ATPase, AAA family protein [Histomonas meleagridis]|uniref:ATPase, AAA family protein n=1 Tax=Histomonas meleagridis TaxID=135588 RepID=UPI00355980ED|nr:ATPase, AAA family protein [Histomonas meleagridis]KAH0803298.1 ATPase, AAA family protein [Histomonas meleagridis]
MSDSAAINHINLAREHARLGNYEASIRSYQNAQQDTSNEIDNCQDPSKLVKWTQLQKYIKDEEAAVLRVKNILDEILENLDNEPQNNHQSHKKNSDFDIALEPPQRLHSPNVDHPQVELRAPERRPVVNISKPRKVTPSRQPVSQVRAPNSQLGRRQSVPTNRQSQNNKPAQNKPSNPKPSPPNAPSKKDDEKPPLDPTDNPLVQQIIDMGILIREPNVSWDSIAGLSQVKRLLRQNLVILPMRPDICKGLLAPWKSVLFYGPPGTGKTFLAKAVATECKRTFFNVTSATISSKWHGESEKLVSYLFTLAEQMAPSTIFFDEIDSIASQRGSGSEHEASRKMKAQLLTKLEGIDSATENSQVFVLAATNFPWDLDEALVRRFQKRIYIPLPDEEGREAILRMNIGEMIDEEFDLKMWAQRLNGYSCADITNLCRDAAQAVFDRKTSLLNTNQWVNLSVEEAKVIITDEDFERAVALRKSSVDKNTLKKYEEWKQTKGAE